VTPSGVITRVAGIAGATEYNGDDKRATEATLAAPAGVAVDASGRYLYIADNGHHRIRQVDLQTNRITTVAGTGTPGFSGDGGWAIQAQLSSPSAVAVDTLGNFYIADVGNRRVRRVDSSGLITTFAGTGQRLSCGDGGPAKQACFKNPVALAVGLTGEVFVADNEDHRVRRIDPSGIITTIAGNGLFNPPNPGPAKDSSVKWPQGLAINAAGNLYISDFASNIVLMLSRDGNLTLVAGTSTPGFSGDGGPATRAMLNGPSGLAVDSFGNLFISDSLNCRVRRLR
jgi:DNA-binding beta-propeller fold protein YncE